MSGIHYAVWLLGLHATPVSHITWKHCIGCQSSLGLNLKPYCWHTKPLILGPRSIFKISCTHICPLEQRARGYLTHTLNCLQHLILNWEYIFLKHDWKKVSHISTSNGTLCRWGWERLHQLSASKNGCRLCFFKVLSLSDKLSRPESDVSIFLMMDTLLLLGWFLDDWTCFLRLRNHLFRVRGFKSTCDFISFHFVCLYHFFVEV